MLVALVVVFGIGAAVVVFSVGNTTDRAQSRACRIEGVTIRTALAAWRSESGGTLPASLDELGGDSGFLDPSTTSSVDLRWQYDVAPDHSSYRLTPVGKCSGFDLGG